MEKRYGVAEATKQKEGKTGENDAGLAGGCGFDAADTEEAFAAALQLSSHFAGIFRGHDQNHADAEIECAQQFILLDFSELREIAEDRQNRPGTEFDDSLHIARKRAREIAGDYSASDVRHAG